MLKKLICLLTAAMFLFPDFRISAADAVSGTFDSGISWSISGSVMTISGTGEMGDVIYQPYASYSSSVTSVVINEGVSSVGYGAFSNFQNLKSVSLPQSLEYIDVNAFSYCYNLYDINIPQSVEYIGSNAFYGTYFIAGIKDDFIVLGDGILYSYKGSDERIIIPDNVKSIADRAFVSEKNAYLLYVPESVKIIRENAFLNCTNLKYAVISSETESVGNNSLGYILNPAPVLKGDFRIYSCSGSAAEKYASDNTIDFTVMGDIDGDGQVTSYDALMILQTVTGSADMSEEQKISADSDMDSDITSYDALTLLQYITGGF